MRIDCTLKLHELSGHQVVEGLDVVVAEHLHRIKKRAKGSVLLDVEELSTKPKLVFARQVIHVLVQLNLISWTIGRNRAARIERQIARKRDVDRSVLIDVDREDLVHVERWTRRLIAERVAGVDAIEGGLRRRHKVWREGARQRNQEVLIERSRAGIEAFIRTVGAGAGQRDVVLQRVATVDLSLVAQVPVDARNSRNIILRKTTAEISRH